LRDVQVGAQRIGLRDAKQHGVAGVNQRAHIDVAHRDHTRKRRAHAEVSLHFGQPPDVGLHSGDVSFGGVHGPFQRSHVGGLGLVLRLILIVLLFRNCSALHQIVPAGSGNLSDGFVGFALLQGRVGACQIRLSLLHGGLRLTHLLIQIGRLHFG